MGDNSKRIKMLPQADDEMRIRQADEATMKE